MFATIAWTAVTITIAFIVIKSIFGLRVSEEEEIVGLDAKKNMVFHPHMPASPSWISPTP